MAYNFKDEEEVKEFLKNLYIEYKFGCLKENNPETCHLLGDYEEAIKKNPEEACKIYKKNCDELNFPRSCAKYGEYRITGRNAAQDVDEAYRYLKKGCDLGDPKGCYLAGIIATHNKDSKEEQGAQVQEGMNFLQKACKANLYDACFHLSGIYIAGIDGHVKKNMEEASKLSLKCCEEGNPYACANYALMLRTGDGVAKDEEKANIYKTKAYDLLEELKKQKKQLQFQRGV